MLWLLGRLILVPLGILLAAFAAATLLIIAGFVQPSIGGALTTAAVDTLRQLLDGLIADGEAMERFARLAVGLSTLTIATLFLPVTLIAAASEVFSLRSWFLQALGAAALTAVLPWAMLPSLLQGSAFASPVTGLLAATGAFAGSIYWMVAGNGAGRGPRSVEERATVRAPRR